MRQHHSKMSELLGTAALATYKTMMLQHCLAFFTVFYTNMSSRGTAPKMMRFESSPAWNQSSEQRLCSPDHSRAARHRLPSPMVCCCIFPAVCLPDTPPFWARTPARVELPTFLPSTTDSTFPFVLGAHKLLSARGHRLPFPTSPPQRSLDVQSPSPPLNTKSVHPLPRPPETSALGRHRTAESPALGHPTTDLYPHADICLFVRGKGRLRGEVWR